MSERERPLRRGDLDSDPLRQLGRWFEEAGALLRAPEAAALATATEEGSPSVRMVLVKHFDEQIDEPEDGKQGVGQVVADVGRELAEDSRAGGRNELALDSRTTLIREGQ